MYYGARPPATPKETFIVLSAIFLYCLFAVAALGRCATRPVTLQECLDKGDAWRTLNLEHGEVTPEFMKKVNDEIRKCER